MIGTHALALGLVVGLLPRVPPSDASVAEVRVPAADGAERAATWVVPASADPVPAPPRCSCRRPAIRVTRSAAGRGTSRTSPTRWPRAASPACGRTAWGIWIGRRRSIADDASALLDWLRAHPEVDRDAVGLVAHGDACVPAMLVTRRDRRAAFVAFLAPSGAPRGRPARRSTAPRRAPTESRRTRRSLRCAALSSSSRTRRPTPSSRRRPKTRSSRSASIRRTPPAAGVGVPGAARQRVDAALSLFPSRRGPA